MIYKFIFSCVFMIIVAPNFLFSMPGVGGDTQGVAGPVPPGVSLDITINNYLSKKPSISDQVVFFNQILIDYNNANVSKNAKEVFKSAVRNIWAKKSQVDANTLKAFLNKLQVSKFNFSDVKIWLDSMKGRTQPDRSFNKRRGS